VAKGGGIWVANRELKSTKKPSSASSTKVFSFKEIE